MSMTILVLGGYGTTGSCIVSLLLKETSAKIRIAGRNFNKAAEAAKAWNDCSESSRVEAVMCDAAKPEDLAKAFVGIQLVVVSSCTAEFTQNIAVAALNAGADYLDLMYPPYKLKVLRSLSEQITRGGRCFITEAGFHPGLPSALVRYADRCLSGVQKANVSTVMRIKMQGPMPESAYELVEAFKDFKARIFKNGSWQEIPMTSLKDFPKPKFGAIYGAQLCTPMFLEELQELPLLVPSLQETGFYVAGFNWFVDYFLLPAILFSLQLFPQATIKPAARLFFWVLKYFSTPPFGVCVRLDAGRKTDGEESKLNIMLCHENAYVFTAIAVTACLLQYLDGTIRKPGLFIMGHLVDPLRLIADMQRLGVQINSAPEQ